jgi:hypothetical protein
MSELWFVAYGFLGNHYTYRRFHIDPDSSMFDLNKHVLIAFQRHELVHPDPKDESSCCRKSSLDWTAFDYLCQHYGDLELDSPTVTDNGSTYPCYKLPNVCVTPCQRKQHMDENPQRLPPVPLFPCPYSKIDDNYIRRVNLKCLTGITAVLNDVPKFLMVDESLMSQIKEQQGIPIELQCLISPRPNSNGQGRAMFEDVPVRSYLTEEDSTIFLLVRLRGNAVALQSDPARPMHMIRSPGNIADERRLRPPRLKRKWTTTSPPSYTPSYWHSYIEENRRLSSSNHRNIFFHQNNSVLVSLPDDLFWPSLLLLASLCHPDSHSDLTDLYQFIRSGTSSLVQNILH